MQTATAADLRNEFRRVSAWIDNGEIVQITRGGVPFAILTPFATAIQAVKPKFNFRERCLANWRGRKFSAAEVKAMDDFELEGQEG